VRQFFTVRFWLAVAAVVGLAALLWAVLPRSSSSVVGSTDEGDELVERDIDLIEPIFAVTGSVPFAMQDGVTDGNLELIIDGTRSLRIPPGTPGEITCEDFQELGTCAVAADMLGDAVLWFSLFPADLRNTINLPAIRELRDQNQVLLANGWVVRRADLVARNCDEDTTSLSDFVRTFGDDAISAWGVPDQRVIRVTCTP
jgi:hypothetical protein